MNPIIADMEGSKPMEERQLLENEIKGLLLKAVSELDHNTYIASILIKKALRKLEKINAEKHEEWVKWAMESETLLGKVF